MLEESKFSYEGWFHVLVTRILNQTHHSIKCLGQSYFWYTMLHKLVRRDVFSIW